jgi:hypothetical protein
LFGSFLSLFVTSGCDTAQRELGLSDIATCGCGLVHQGLFQGFAGGVDCTTNEIRCLVPPAQYCASGTINYELTAGIFTTVGINSNVSACFDVESGFPAGVNKLDGKICFEFSTNDFKFDKCTVAIGEEKCTKCDICSNGLDFTFDCSNIRLETESTMTSVNGPNVTECLGFSTLPIP